MDVFLRSGRNTRPPSVPSARFGTSLDLSLRPWLDHGQWGLRHPLAKHPKPRGGPETYVFLPAEGESLHEIPVGPVHAGIIEPGPFRFTTSPSVSMGTS